MIMSKESVNDLNDRIEKPITPLQLRPNLVVEGCEAFAEDNWEWIKIGEQAIIRSFKLCTRFENAKMIITMKYIEFINVLFMKLDAR